LILIDYTKYTNFQKNQNFRAITSDMHDICGYLWNKIWSSKHEFITQFSQSRNSII